MSITTDEDPIFTLTTGPVDVYPEVLRGLARPVGGGSLTPMTNKRFAPRWIAGLKGEVWRIAPSPK